MELVMRCALSAAICLFFLGTSIDLASAQPPPVPAPPKAAPPKAKPPAPQPPAPSAGAFVDEATPEQQQAASAAYGQAMAHVNKGQYEEALAKFRESFSIVASPNTMVMIIRSLVELKRLREAYVAAVGAAAEAEEIAIYNRKYEKAAEELAANVEAIRGQIGLLTVIVKGAENDATLKVGGIVVPQDSWGKEVAVLPGAVEVVLTTPAGEVKEATSVAAGASGKVEIAAPAAQKAPEPLPPDDQAGSGWQGPDRRLMAYIAGGVGALGFIGVGVFGTLSDGRLDLLERACAEPDYCDPELEFHADRGMAYQTVANVSLVVGIVGVGAGVGLWLWDFFDRGGVESAAAIRPTITVGPGSLGVRGRF